MKALDLATKVGGQLFGENREVGKPVSIFEAADGDLLFCSPEYYERTKQLKNCIIFVQSGRTDIEDFSKNTHIMCLNPRLNFAKALKLLYPEPGPSYISSNNHEIFFDKECTIGTNVRIYNNVTMMGRVIIGDNVIINAGSVIGINGFGYERDENNKLVQFPHIGGVTIGDDVHIGANTVINCGTLSDTEIGIGSKLDSHIHIAHNVKIGKHCSIASFSVFGGGTVLGDYSTVATGVSTRNGISIGKNAFLGLGAVITKNVPDDTTVMGNPARPINDAKKYLRFIKKIISQEERIKENGLCV